MTRNDNWNYNKGEFYVGHGGTSIVYIEENPCGCCTNSAMIITQSIHRRRRNPVTHYFGNLKEGLKNYRKNNNLVHLEKKRDFTESEIVFWEKYWVENPKSVIFSLGFQHR